MRYWLRRWNVIMNQTVATAVCVRGVVKVEPLLKVAFYTAVTMNGYTLIVRSGPTRCSKKSTERCRTCLTRWPAHALHVVDCAARKEPHWTAVDGAARLHSTFRAQSISREWFCCRTSEYCASNTQCRWKGPSKQLRLISKSPVVCTSTSAPNRSALNRDRLKKFQLLSVHCQSLHWATCASMYR